MSSARTKITSEDCRSCGACCVGGFDDGHGWADCTRDDIQRMSPRVRQRLVRIHYGLSFNPAIAATPTRMDPTYGKMCGFLRGTPGRRCSCSIYAQRPAICADFAPGSEGCRRSRRQLELELPA